MSALAKMREDMKRVAAIPLFAACFFVAGGTGVAAEQAPRPHSPCAIVKSLENWKPVDETTVIVETSPAHRYKISFTAPCREMKWTTFARIERRPGAGVCLASGDAIVFGRRTLFPLFPPHPNETEEHCVIGAVDSVADGSGPARMPKS